jgi:hypothetical protein
MIKANEQLRRSIMEQFDICYNGDYENWVNVIKAYFVNKPFSKDTLDNMFFEHDNVVQKIIKRKTAGIFTKDPKIVLRDKNNNEIDDKNLPAVLKEINFIAKIKDAYEKSKFFNVIISHIVYSQFNNKLRVDLITPSMCTVEVEDEDYLQMKSIRVQHAKPDGEIFWTYWDKVSHYLLDDYSNTKAPDKNPDMKNPYGILPFPVLRDKEDIDFWGNPNWPLFLFQMAYDLKISDNDRGEFYHKFPIGIGVNLNLPDKDKVGPGYISNTKDVNNDKPTPSLDYVSAPVEWGELRENEKARREALMSHQGIPAASASSDIKDLSGASKSIDEKELIESQNDDKIKLYNFIIDSLNVLRIVHNTHFPNRKISEGNFDCIFTEDEITETEADKTQRWDRQTKYGIKDKLDLVMEELELPQPEAEKYIQERNDRKDSFGINDNSQPGGILNKIKSTNVKVV